jgi:hypothetical protein
MPKAAANKTGPTGVPVEDFLATVPDERKRQDARTLIALMSRISGEPAEMWGPSIIGFGRCHYKYESGREGEMGLIGFSPRKEALTVYLVDGIAKYDELFPRLGPHKLGKACCLYVKRLSDVDMSVLEELIQASYDYVIERKDNMHKV